MLAVWLFAIAVPQLAAYLVGRAGAPKTSWRLALPPIVAALSLVAIALSPLRFFEGSHRVDPLSGAAAAFVLCMAFIQGTLAHWLESVTLRKPPQSSLAPRSESAFPKAVAQTAPLSATSAAVSHPAGSVPPSAPPPPASGSALIAPPSQDPTLPA